MKYFISPLDKPELHFNRDKFITALRQQWSTAGIRDGMISPAIHEFEWSIPELDALDGGLHRSRLLIVLESSTAGCVAFALWLRAFIAPAIRLLFMDEGYNVSVELRPGSTAEEIERALVTEQHAQVELLDSYG